MSSSSLSTTSLDLSIPVLEIAPRARLYSPAQWNEKRRIITELYSHKPNRLCDVQAILAEEHNFFPSLSVLKAKLRSWGLTKNAQEADILAALGIALQLGRVVKDSYFSVRGRQITWKQIHRYFKRRGFANPRQLIESEVGSLFTTQENDSDQAKHYHIEVPSQGIPLQVNLASDGRMNDHTELPSAHFHCQYVQPGFMDSYLRSTEDMECLRLLLYSMGDYQQLFPHGRRNVNFQICTFRSNLSVALMDHAQGNFAEAFRQFNVAFELVASIMAELDTRFVGFLIEVVVFMLETMAPPLVQSLLNFVRQLSEVNLGPKHPVSEASLALLGISPEARRHFAEVALDIAFDSEVRLLSEDTYESSAFLMFWGWLGPTIRRREGSN